MDIKRKRRDELNKESNALPHRQTFKFLGKYYLKPVMAAGVAFFITLSLLATSISIKAEPVPDSNVTDSGSLVNEVVQADQAIKSINSRLDELESKSSRLDSRISELEENLSAEKEHLEAQKSALSKRVRLMYMNGRYDGLAAFLSSDDISDYMEKAEYQKIISSNNAKLVKEITESASNIEQNVASLKDERSQVKSVTAQLRNKKKSLEAKREKRRQLIASAGAGSGKVEAASKQVENKFAEINSQVPAPPSGGKTMLMIATAYSAQEPGLSDSTATGMKARKGVVAVDPRVIPLGTRLYVQGYGYAIAGDTGGAIKGNRIDLCFDTLAECMAYGWRTVEVKIL